MTQKNIHDLSKADVERFLYAKHLTSCPVCSRFRSSGVGWRGPKPPFKLPGWVTT